MRSFFSSLAIVLMFPTAATADHHIPNAITADPSHYTVEFENDIIRVVRIKYDPGEVSTMHTHDANCVINLMPGEIRMEFPDGSSSPGPTDMPGEVVCNDGGAHLPSNVGDTVTEAVLVEMKGRTTAK